MISNIKNLKFLKRKVGIMIEEFEYKTSLKKLKCGNKQDICAHIWRVTNVFDKLNIDEQKELIDIIYNISENYSNNMICNWVLHFLSNTIYLTSSNHRDIYIKIYKKYVYHKEKSIVDKAFEGLARNIYLLNKKQINFIYDTLIDYSTTEEHYISSEYQICCAVLNDHLDEKSKNNFAELTLKNNPYFKKYNPPSTKVDIVFFIPDFLSGKSFLQYPIGELTCATILKQSGINAHILDNRIYHLSDNNILKILDSINPQFIVLTTTPYDQVSIYYCDYRWNIIKNCCKVLKQHGYKLIICGSHGTVKPLEVYEQTSPDILVKGEFELVIKQIYSHLQTNHNNWDDFDNVSNIVYTKNNKIIETAVNRDTYMPDISNFPIPDLSLIDVSSYYGDEYINNIPYTQFSWGSILSQRGCPFSCDFCYNFFGRNIRSRLPVQVVDEMEIMEKSYGITHLFFVDYTFTANREWVIELCKLIIERNLKILWNCETRADCLDEELLKYMHNAGCNRIWLGVETFSNELLSDCNKGTNETIVKNAIGLICQNGIKVSCFLMLGLPKETPKTIEHTLKQVKLLGAEYTKSIITVIPRYGTELYKKAQKHVANETFEEIYSLRGLVDNEITEYELTQTIQLMMNRDTESWETYNDYKRI